MNRFVERRALVTGGASGIGQATARLLQAEGARVAIVDRAPDEQDGLVALAADIADEEQVRGVVEAGERALGGPIDLLVNSAGIYHVTPLLDLDVREWDRVLAVNATGSLLVAREVARRLLAAGRSGAIVNVASTAAFFADPQEPAGAYNASKAAVVALTKEMAVEWGPAIRVNAVAPGVISTPLIQQLYDTGIRDPEVEQRTYVQARVPLRRLGQPADIANAIAFLLSDQSGYMTGETVTADGGAALI